MSSLFRRRGRAADQTPDPVAADESPNSESDETPQVGTAADTAAGTAADTPPGAVSEADAPPRAGVKSRGHTAGKGRPTPKRRDARKRSAEPPPKDRKEAYRRMRQRQKQERAEARAAMLAGDERYLPRRDRGPERALVRNIVDARRNIGTWFFGGAVLILVGTWPTMPEPVRFASEVVWAMLLVAVVVDSILLARLVKRLVWQRHPGTSERRRNLYTYAIMRSLQLRRMRIPKPQVSIGDSI